MEHNLSWFFLDETITHVSSPPKIHNSFSLSTISKASFSSNSSSESSSLLLLAIESSDSEGKLSVGSIGTWATSGSTLLIPCEILRRSNWSAKNINLAEVEAVTVVVEGKVFDGSLFNVVKELSSFFGCSPFI